MKKLTIPLGAVLVLSLTLLLSACGEAATTTEPPPTTAPPAGGIDIVETAVAAGSFTTLIEALEKAGLVDTLRGSGPFTVFAPTDEAFAKLPEGLLDDLLADPTGELHDILLYHVLPLEVEASEVTDGLRAATVQGATVFFTIQDGEVMINDATIVQTDIEATNGLIHVIDTVILPPAPSG